MGFSVEDASSSWRFNLFKFLCHRFFPWIILYIVGDPGSQNYKPPRETKRVLSRCRSPRPHSCSKRSCDSGPSSSGSDRGNAPCQDKKGHVDPTEERQTRTHTTGTDLLTSIQSPLHNLPNPTGPVSGGHGPLQTESVKLHRPLAPVAGNNSRVGKHVELLAAPSAQSREPTTREPSQFRGIQLRGNRWVAEIRPSLSNKKIWIGSFKTAEEAAAAYDVGIFYSQKKDIPYNFPISPSLLQGVQIPLDLDSLKDAIQHQAKIAARRMQCSTAIVAVDQNSVNNSNTTSVSRTWSQGADIVDRNCDSLEPHGKSLEFHRALAPVGHNISAGRGQAEQATSTARPQESSHDVPACSDIHLRHEHNQWVVTIPPSRITREAWIGRYNTREEALAVFDVALFFCRKDRLPYNSSSPPPTVGTSSSAPDNSPWQMFLSQDISDWES